MIEIIYSPYIIFSLWVLLCYQFQTHEIRLKQNDILFHSLLILKIPFSKENFNLNNKFFIVQKNLRWQNLANLLYKIKSMKNEEVLHSNDFIKLPGHGKIWNGIIQPQLLNTMKLNNKKKNDFTKSRFIK